MDSSVLGMQVAIRADASDAIGSGHVMRCTTLACALRELGAEVRFICRDLPGNYADWIHSQGFKVAMLPAPKIPLPVNNNIYASWLGVDTRTEIIQSRMALVDTAVDWLIVDHYALDIYWERAVCPHNARLLVIDDLANRPHCCNLLLDHNYNKFGAERYERLALGAELMLGPRFALLRPDFANIRRDLRPRTGQVRKLLVFVGGSDNKNVNSLVLRALESRVGDGLAIDMIIGRFHRNLDELRLQCEQVGASLYTQVDDMAARIADADLGIGATGVATWERASLGLPTLAVSVADNQREIARQAASLGILRWLGDATEVSESDWREAIDWACTNPEALIAQSRAGMEAVDGLGQYRIIQRMHAH